MESFEMLPTEENLILALSENILKRNLDLVYFYDLLLEQETASAIAIDGRWGSGKTFFVKQSLLIINAQNPMSEMDKEKRRKILYNIPFKQKTEESLNYDIGIYYDAWENDNDLEPVLSIIYEITKQLGLTYTFETDCKIFKTAGAIIEAISGRNINGIVESLKSENPIAKFKEQKDIEENLKTFFSEVLVERGNRLIIFIDELDRCKPSFAVRLLEQIKHYLSDQRITFVFSVNLEELQHTIKHYYGNAFDACRYLDRFFDIRIQVPPANMREFYDKMGLNIGYALEKVCKRVIVKYNFELREITRYYRQVKTAVFEPTHESLKWDFSFSDGNAKKLILIYIVPIIIGLRISNISIHDEFINEKNVQPLIEILEFEEMGSWFLNGLLNDNETFDNEQNKKKVTKEQKINILYKAIFVNDYSGRKYCEHIGNYEFDANSKLFAIRTASLLSDYANYNI